MSILPKFVQLQGWRYIHWITHLSVKNSMSRPKHWSYRSYELSRSLTLLFDRSQTTYCGGRLDKDVHNKYTSQAAFPWSVIHTYSITVNSDSSRLSGTGIRLVVVSADRTQPPLSVPPNLGLCHVQEHVRCNRMRCTDMWTRLWLKILLNAVPKFRRRKQSICRNVRLVVDT